MLLAGELALDAQEAQLLDAARAAHYADGSSEIQNERIAAQLERGVRGEPAELAQ